MESKTAFCLLLTILLASTGLTVAGQSENMTNFMGKQPSSEQIVNALKSPAEPKMKYRSIHVKPVQPKVLLDLRFELDSDKLTEETKETLAALGEALADEEFERNGFIVKGHTDSRGTEKYNQNLSKLRALAVTNYLVEKYGVNPSQLEAIGKGEQELFNAADPESGENRRVEVVNIGQATP